MRFLKYSLPVLCLLLAECTSVSGHKEKERLTMAEYKHPSDDMQPREECSPAPQPKKSAMALYMDSLGLVNIAELDSSITVKLMYTQADNFTGEVLSRGRMLRRDADRLPTNHRKAQEALKQLHPSYNLVVYDAARPMSVQKKMWNVVKGTPKYKYVSNPNRGGGLHNYGLAVDISIQDSLGQPLPMGTKVDHLGIEAHITQESELVRNGKISEAERQNRILLRRVMKEAGFRALPNEWWHFNFCSRDVARQKYKVIP